MLQVILWQLKTDTATPDVVLHKVWPTPSTGYSPTRDKPCRWLSTIAKPLPRQQKFILRKGFIS